MGKDKRKNLALSRQKQEANKYFRLGVAGVAAVALIGFCMVYSLGKFGQVHDLTTDPLGTEKLKQVFFSGEPWLVQCVNDEVPLHSASILTARNAASYGVSVGSLPCLESLPSGKNFFQRFNFPDTQLQDKDHPLFFLFANGDPPQRPKGNDLRNASTIVQFAIRESLPRVHTVSTLTNFNFHCNRRKECVLLVAAGEPDLASYEWVAKKHRNVRIVAVNTNEVALSFLAQAGVQDEKSISPKEPKVIILRNAQTEADIAKAREHKELVAAAKKDKSKTKEKLPPAPSKPYGLYVVKGSSPAAVDAAIVSHAVTGEPRGGEWVAIIDAKAESTKRVESAQEKARRLRRDQARKTHEKQKRGDTSTTSTDIDDENLSENAEKKELGDDLDLDDEDVVVDDE